MKKQGKENSENKPIRQRRTIGAIMAIPVDGYYVYMQSLDFGREVVFDYRSDTILTDLSPLLKAKEMFRVCVYAYPISNGTWRKIGKLPIREDLTSTPMQFIYHAYNGKFELYNPETGNMTPSTKEQCKGLEPAAIWGQEHVEQRVRDYYNGKPCSILKNLFELVNF